MLSNLIYYLILETFEPSYGTLLSIVPQEIIASAMTEKLNDKNLEIPYASTLNLSLDIPNAPQKTGDSIAPVLAAKSVYALDLNSGSPLFVNDIFTRRPIASIAKLMTAMVILDNHDLNEKVKVSKAAALTEGSSMMLLMDEEMTVGDLLTGMLINSGNDAAFALAEYDAGNEAAFVKKMNQKGIELGLKDTNFSNAKGFDEPGNYATAFDVMIFGRAALEYPFIRKTVQNKTYEVYSVDKKIKHELKSTNELLENPFFKVVGLKTGSTPAAGESFVSLVQGPNNHEILTVMLHSPDRFQETKVLIDWLLRNYKF